ncbi:copper resistance protein CopC [Actinoplanes sp. DH11]|uniref:copper resistance CopC/CopD family protein n=1 Tax=Actinoplanes sp. DH11 TaxID=2857011 RepID=UPI001E494281|nr:copper resistance protein CopC [Actinoplanes sp. DH11]
MTDRRRVLAVLAGLLLGLFGTLLSAAPASAHAALVGSDPGNGTIVPDAPPRVTLTFSESVQLLSGKIRVIAPDGSQANQGDPTVSGTEVTIPLRSGGGRGTYLVSYRVISADSHPVAGTISYSVGAASTPPTDTAGEAPADPVVRGLIPVAKYLGYAGLVLLVGPVLVLALLWPQRLSRRGPGRLIWTGIGLVTGSTLVALYLQAPYTLGTGLFDVRVGDLRDVLGSTFGAVMLVRLGVVIAAAFLLRPLLVGSGGGESKLDLALLGVLGVAALATWPLTGHPTASPVAGVSVVIDAIHLAAMAVWLGGLVMLFGFLLRQANGRELGAILPIWSRWAATAVAALVFAGVVQALIEVSTLDGLINSTYGRLILAKVALAAIVIGVAAYSRKLVKERAAEESPGPLRRIVAVELAITAVVLGVTSALVQISPPRTAEAAETSTVSTVSQTITAPKMSLKVDLFPAAVGNNSIHLYAYTPDNKPLPVVEWKATAALTSAGIEPIEIPLLRITDFHAIGDIALPAAGEWTFKFTARTSEIDQSTLTMTAKVS